MDFGLFGLLIITLILPHSSLPKRLSVASLSSAWRTKPQPHTHTPTRRPTTAIPASSSAASHLSHEAACHPASITAPSTTGPNFTHVTSRPNVTLCSTCSVAVTYELSVFSIRFKKRFVEVHQHFLFLFLKKSPLPESTVIYLKVECIKYA